MATTIANMSKEELKEMIESSVEEKLLELLGDPDQDQELRKSVRDRLLRQKKLVATGEHGQSLEAVSKKLGLS